MHTSQALPRLHPLVAGAAASVLLVSLLGAAAITGILPTSHGTSPQLQAQAAAAPAATKSTDSEPPKNEADTLASETPRKKSSSVRQANHIHRHSPSYAASSAQPVYPAATPPLAQAPTQPTQPAQVMQPAPIPQPVQEPKPTTGIGIATGAVIGGLLGNQIGGGSGRKLATIAGVIGGGYVGNEIEKRAR